MTVFYKILECSLDKMPKWLHLSRIKLFLNVIFLLE